MCGPPLVPPGISPSTISICAISRWVLRRPMVDNTAMGAMGVDGRGFGPIESALFYIWVGNASIDFLMASSSQYPGAAKRNGCARMKGDRPLHDTLQHRLPLSYPSSFFKGTRVLFSPILLHLILHGLDVTGLNSREILPAKSSKDGLSIQAKSPSFRECWPGGTHARSWSHPYNTSHSKVCATEVHIHI